MECWIVTEGMAGTENQCIGVAEALGFCPAIKRIGLRPPWTIIAPHGPVIASAFTGDALVPPWPDLLIAAGRKAVPAARYIKKASGGKTFTVFLQNPRMSTDAFDLVAAPAHDCVKGANVVATAAAPNRLTHEKLNDARQDWESVFGALPSPRVAVLIGGNSRAHRLTDNVMGRLIQQLQTLSAKNHGLMMTASRRTDADKIQALRDHVIGPNVWMWDGAGSNPYFGMLAWADYIVVTSDSVSMISDAATTGKPVYMIPLEGGSARFDFFHKSLLDKGIVRMFDGALSPYAYAPLNDAALVAAAIRERARFA